MERNDKMKSPGRMILEIIVGIGTMIMWVCFGIFIVLLTGMGNGRR
jgi:hypothetical protein